MTKERLATLAKFYRRLRALMDEERYNEALGSEAYLENEKALKRRRARIEVRRKELHLPHMAYLRHRVGVIDSQGVHLTRDDLFSLTKFFYSRSDYLCDR